MKLEKEVYIENTATTGELSSIIIRGYMETKEREILYKLRDKTAKLTLEYQEPILDEAERKYLSGVIRPFRDRIEYILKSSFMTGREFLHMKTKDGDMMDMFPFEPNKMYKGMKLNKEYSLEELRL